MLLSFHQLLLFVLAALALCQESTPPCENTTAVEEVLNIPSNLNPKPFNTLENTTAIVYLACRNEENCFYYISDGVTEQGAPIIYHNYTGADECQRQRHKLHRWNSGSWTLDNYDELYIGHDPTQPDVNATQPTFGQAVNNTIRRYPIRADSVYSNIGAEYLRQRCAEWSPFWPVDAEIDPSMSIETVWSGNGHDPLLIEDVRGENGPLLIEHVREEPE
jgi:hypothetical protein